MDDSDDSQSRGEGLAPRTPAVEDLADLCRILNELEAKDVVIREVGGVPIPFASPRLLWRMKAKTHRAKDASDLVFLREYFKARRETPPEV